MVKLDEYFDHKKNVPFERHKLREAEQESGESVNSFVTRLRKLSIYCEFGTEVENNIRDQLVSNASQLILGGVC